MSHVRVLLGSLLITLLVGLSSGPGFADDTDIYLRQADELTESTRPNILFIFDNSGSMNYAIRNDKGEPTGTRRVDVLKEALDLMLDRVHNVNVGLGRFASLITKPAPPVNVPIMFPVAYIDERVSEIEGEIDDTIVDVSVSVIRSSDDAEENVGTKKVNLTDPELEMVHLISTGEPPGVKVEKPIENKNDDVVEWLGLGDRNFKKNQLVTNKGIIYFGVDPESDLSKNQGDSLVGLRFEGLGIPRGATIEHAEVEFVSDDDYENNLKIKIYGAANDGKPQDASGVSFKNETGYLSNLATDNFPPTTAEVEWSLASEIREGQVYKTKNIKSIIQEIVSRDGWNDNNGLVLLFKRTSDSSEETRGFYSFDNLLSKNPPTLRVYWTLEDAIVSVVAGRNPDDGSLAKNDIVAENSKFSNSEIRLGKQRNHNSVGNGEETSVGVRFQALPIPQGAKITEAKITFTYQNGSEEAEGKKGLNLLIYGEKSVDAVPFTDNDGEKVSDRLKLEGDPVSWKGVGYTRVGEQFSTPSLTEILQEMVAQADWASGNSVAFLFEPEGTAPGLRRIVGPNDFKKKDGSAVDEATVIPDENTLPKLEVQFSVGLPEEEDGDHNPDEDKQIVGLRFEAADIPQGATITRAAITFTSSADASTAGKFQIRAENVDDASTFTEEDEDISKRMSNLTSAEVDWSLKEDWSNGVPYSSEDLSPIVQEIVNREGWCGGVGGLVFIIESKDGTPFRQVKSYDDNPVQSPTLEVYYDSKNINGSGCVYQTYSGQIVSRDDDAEQLLNDNSMFPISNSLELGVVTSKKTQDESRLVGFRYDLIPIPPKMEIVQAHLILTALKDREGEGTLTISGELSSDGNSAPFTNEKNNLGRRSTTTATKSWSLSEPWERGNIYRSPDLKDVIQEIVNQSSWKTYNSLSLFIKGSSGRRDVFSFEVGRARAAVLQIQVKGYLGEEGEGDFLTVRRRLKKIVKQMEIPSSNTAIVEGLYESARYFRGEGVSYGKSRHGEAEYLVSHPGSYTGGTVEPLEGCNIHLAPLDEKCAEEEIQGTPNYISPIHSKCQTNHIVLLTDGLANKSTAIEKVQDMIGKSDCYKTYPDPDNPEETVGVAGAEKCGIDLAEFLKSNDNVKKQEGLDNNVKVHTIGFQLGKAWKPVYETEGGDEGGDRVYKIGGSYFSDKEGNNAVDPKKNIKLVGYEEDTDGTDQNDEAVKYLKEIATRGGGDFYSAESVDDLLKAFDSIIGDAMTTSTSFAAPTLTVNRFNNLFHRREIYYALFKPDQKQRWEGNIKKYMFDPQDGLVDANGDPAVDDEKKYIREDAQSYWSKVRDGTEVTKGGAGEQIPVSSARKIYTYITNPTEGRPEPVPGGDHDLVNLETWSLAPEKLEEDKEFKQDLAAALFVGEEEYTEAELEQLIGWIRGEAVTQEGVERWKFADPLHSSPGSVTYDIEVDAEGKEKLTNKLFVGTNDGLIRMLDSETGIEEWAFLPQELLSVQRDLMANKMGPRIYGVDASPSFWIRDKDEDVKIDPNKGDFVRIFIGMRRGGKNIYALDVTGTTSKPGSSPKLMWVIKGGEPPFDKLGQTWSFPTPVKVEPRYCDQAGVKNFDLKKDSCIALLFGGGYHTSQDEGRFSSTDDEEFSGGNAIYMVHAETGQLLWWASSADSGADLENDHMIYPIPSDLTLIDEDGNGLQDLIYVGDLGGQVWRIALNMEDDQGNIIAVGGRVASISDPASFSDRRRFFYPPEVVKRSVGTVVVIGSGTRSEPLDREVHNQFYVLIETWEEDSQGNPILRTLTQDDLWNVTEIDEDDDAQVYLDPASDNPGGWYMNLQKNDAGEEGLWAGEKVLAKPVLLKDKVFFTTYLPPDPYDDACDFFEGKSWLYGLYIDSGKGALNDLVGGDDDDDDDDDSDSKSIELREGITSALDLMLGDDGKWRLASNDPTLLKKPQDEEKLHIKFWKQEF